MSIKLQGWQRCLVAGVALVGLVSTSRAQSEDESRPPAPRRTSIVLIVADHLGWGDLGCYGQTKIKTPNLDRLAAEGVRFTDFYAGAAADGPSRAALMLGQHTGHLNVQGAGTTVDLSEEVLTAAQFLKQSGYRTGFRGVWGLGAPGSPGVPQKQGFDNVAALLNDVEAGNDYLGYIWRHNLDPIQGDYDGKVELSQNDEGKKGLYIPDLLTTAGTNFIRINRPDQINSWRPFFLMMAYTIPQAGERKTMPKSLGYADSSVSEPERRKAAMIANLDADVGKLLATLKAYKVQSNTVVIFTSANGPQKGDGVDPKTFGSTGPLRGAGGQLTEGGIRVPLIVWSPKYIKPAVVTEPWAAWDIFPTMAEIALRQAPTNIDGISFMTTLYQGKQTNRHDHFYWESPGEHVQQAVRAGDWKAFRPQAGAKLELYNLKTDPGEATNAAGKNPDVVARMEKYMRAIRIEPGGNPKDDRKDKAKP